MGKLERLKGLRASRREKGLSQEALALKAGIRQPDVSDLECGGLSMSRAVAEKLAPVVGSNPIMLQFENRALRLETAKQRDDREGVFQAAKSAIKLLDGIELSAEEEAALDELVDAAIAFTQSVGDKRANAAQASSSVAESSAGDPYMGGLARAEKNGVLAELEEVQATSYADDSEAIQNVARLQAEVEQLQAECRAEQTRIDSNRQRAKEHTLRAVEYRYEQQRLEKIHG